jgi:hypothetical protein
MLDLSKVQSQKFSAGHDVSAVLRIFTVPVQQLPGTNAQNQILVLRSLADCSMQIKKPRCARG